MTIAKVYYKDGRIEDILPNPVKRHAARHFTHYWIKKYFETNSERIIVRLFEKDKLKEYREVKSFSAKSWDDYKNKYNHHSIK